MMESEEEIITEIEDAKEGSAAMCQGTVKEDKQQVTLPIWIGQDIDPKLGKESQEAQG